MADLTVTVDENVLRRARIRALEHGTSVDAVVADYLERYAGSDATTTALAGFLEWAVRITAGSGDGGRMWRRNELYDRPNIR
jgi:plasmid stability protein